MSTFNSSSKAWHWFIAVLFGVPAAILLLAFLFVAVIDPYDSLAFSPQWKRYRVTGNERYSFPGLIRHSNFDSAVFGTSTIMLLKPNELSDKLGGCFANFAMSAGTAWEQSQLMKFFVSHSRPSIRTIVVAIDEVWCAPAAPAARLTRSPFPPWQYDDDPWNDYAHLLNTRALIHAVRQLLTMTGIVSPQFQDDGYFQFTPEDSQYDPARARAQLYKSNASPRAADMVLPELEPRPADWTYPDLSMLAETLDHFPAQTRKILMFMPYHLADFASAAKWPRFAHCKSAAVSLAQARPNVAVIDFMRPSTLTRDDSAYWDPSHYRIAHANAIIESLRDAFVAGKDSGALYEILWRPGGEASGHHEPETR